MKFINVRFKRTTTLEEVKEAVTEVERQVLAFVNGNDARFIRTAVDFHGLINGEVTVTFAATKARTGAACYAIQAAFHSCERLRASRVSRLQYIERLEMSTAAGLR